VGRTLLLAAIALLTAAPAAASAKVRPGPPGDAFYAPPAKLPGARHDPPFSERLRDAYARRGNPVRYRTYDGADHGTIVRAAARDATRRLQAWLRR
jgi:hypothetical protein